MTNPLWQPSPERVARAHVTRFAKHVEQREGRHFPAYADLHRWSIEQAPLFWRHLWDYCGVAGEPGDRLVADRDRMPGAKFLPDARLNFVENVLSRSDTAPAIVAVTEQGPERRLTFAELRDAVLRTAAALLAEGVEPGDRVAGIVANIPEAVIAALATAAIGAVWSCCSPDFGADGIVDRFGQIAPRVLISVDGYFYGGKTFDCLQKLTDVVRRLPTLTRVIVVPLVGGNRADKIAIATSWDDWMRDRDVLAVLWERFPFNHPLYVLFSSGTTGVPKCIVHGAGGTLLQHLKEHQLQSDISAGDRVFYFTTCSWMMWNWLVTVLATGATIVLYDGSPFHPGPHVLFDLADKLGVTFFGASAKYLDSVRKSGLRPRETHDLSTVRTIASTGSPLAAETFDFVYESIKRDVHLASISGGTDIVSCFVLGNPAAAVWRGEIQAAGLGMDVQVFDADGRRLDEAPGELVCASPFPAMPLGFWNDPDGRHYQAAYFERFPGVWCHGDWVSHTAHDGFVIYGRSDTTLKPGGVRIGTAEIYRQVEQLREVQESLAVGQQWNGDERIILFVRLAPDAHLDDRLRQRIVDRLRTHASPRHVPARIVQVAEIPRTRSGKIVELAVRQVIHGRPVANREALANPDALDLYRDLPELQS